MDTKTRVSALVFLYEIINYLYNSESYYCKNKKYKK